MGEFLTYKKFSTPWEAEPVIGVLKENDIPYKFIKSTPIADSIIAGQVSSYAYELLVDQDQFEEANQLLQEVAETETEVEQMGEDYYLYSFSDRELNEILAKPDEWGEFDYSLARKILEERGISNTDQQLEQKRAARNEHLAKPESDSTSSGLVAAGYIFSIGGAFLSLIVKDWAIPAVIHSAMPAIGPFIGLAIGLTLINSTRTLPDGRKVQTYSQKSRKQAKTLIVFALIFMALSMSIWLTVRLN